MNLQPRSAWEARDAWGWRRNSRTLAGRSPAAASEPSTSPLEEGGRGGGIYSSADLTLNDCDLLDNEARAGGNSSTEIARGGGIYIAGATLTLTRSVVDSNLVLAQDGGETPGGAYARGGGIYIGGFASATLVNAFVTRNDVAASGNPQSPFTGGIFIESGGSAEIIHSTVADNEVEGVRNDGFSLNVVNSILWGNGSTEVSGDATVTYSDVMGGVPGEGNIDQNPQFLVPDVLDPSYDVHIDMSSSPCVDRGTDTAPGLPGDDIDGDLRPQRVGYDMGADEEPGAPTPTPTPTPTPGTPTPTPSATPTPTVTPVPGLREDQKKCVKLMNKSGQKVDGAQLKENERCLSDHQKGKLAPLTVEACTTADRKGKVQKAQEKTVAGEEKKCDSLSVPPPFGYTDSTTVNDAAVAGSLGLIHAIFGDPIDDGDLFTNAIEKDGASCQGEMLKRADQLENTVLKELVKAKKRAIKEPDVNDAALLRDALAAVLSSNQKIVKKENQLAKRVDGKCASLSHLPSTIFPGACAAPTLAEVADCVIAAARREACLKINAFDGLSLDCD